MVNAPASGQLTMCGERYRSQHLSPHHRRSSPTHITLRLSYIRKLRIDLQSLGDAHLRSADNILGRLTQLNTVRAGVRTPAARSNVVIGKRPCVERDTDSAGLTR